MTPRLYVGNVHWSATSNDLRNLLHDNDYFPKDVYIVKDRETSRSRGFGFVEFESVEDAQEAFDSLQGLLLFDRPLTFRLAEERKFDRPINTAPSYPPNNHNNYPPANSGPRRNDGPPPRQPYGARRPPSNEDRNPGYGSGRYSVQPTVEYTDRPQRRRNTWDR